MLARSQHAAADWGLASLIIGFVRRLNIREAEGFEFAHGLVEATKRAFRVRDRVVTDPMRLPQPPAQFLEQKFLDAEVLKIDRRRAAKWPAPSGEGDTIWMGAADSSGLAVSYIQSLYWEFGSGCVLPKTGVLMQNRGSSFSLDPKALNTLAPGRLPFHTLNPALAVLNDGRVIAYGTMGGDGQPQSRAMIFARMCCTVSRSTRRSHAPRWLGPHLGLDPHQSADGVPLRRPSGRAVDVRRPRRRRAGGCLFRHHGPRRRW
jgi:gamma-glutamyltranspeptidase/glutathione hydrolase